MDRTEVVEPGKAGTGSAGGERALEHAGWAATRFALGGLRYRIPAAANRLPYMLGGFTFLGLVVLALTGVWLDQLYNPDPLAAHASVVYTVTRAPLGAWVRALHYWAACVVLVSVALHLIHVFRRRSYVAPREVTWWSGVLLLVLVGALAFTGTVLRADQEGGEALAHAVAAAELLGPVGAPLSPDFAPGTSLLARIHNAHVSLLPLLLAGTIALHFWLIRHLGINAPASAPASFAEHLRRLLGYGLIGIAALCLVAALLPPALGHRAVDGVEVTKPFWPFLWIYALENTIGLWGMIVGPAVILGFLVAVPLLDRRAARPAWLVALAAALLVALLGALAYGFVAPQMQHIGM
ncbi:MAG TPA: cytochrome b N-terminal domain-containing protein [Longimicrobiales bacterium]